jgi:hypothetical protein
MVPFKHRDLIERLPAAWPQATARVSGRNLEGATSMPEKVRCLNPIGIADSVQTIGLAPRLTEIDGKNICLSICGEPDITIPLEKRLKSDYPNVNWTVKKTYGTDPVELTEEEMKTTDALIQGVAW